ncbi:MAG: tetratricopeptide repeat protein [Pleurocapsa sp.]
MSHTIGQVKQDNQQSNSNSSQANLGSAKSEDNTLKSTSVLSDADYEFLFNQLLEGIAHGWHDRRIAKFFIQLGDRGKQADWVAWLDRFQGEAASLPVQSKRQLGTTMIRLGEITQSTTEINQIAAASYRIGRELLLGSSPAVIWEYVGPDLTSESSRLQPKTEPESSIRLTNELAASDSPTVEEQPEFSSEPLAQLSENSIKEVITSAVPDSTSKNSQNTQKLSELAEASNSAKSDASSPLKHPNDQDNDPVAIDMQQVMQLIQKDQELARQISQKLNLAQVKPQVTEVTPDELDRSSLELIESWFELGLKQVSAGEFKKAIASWEKALNLNPNLSEAWHNRGSALGRLGNYEAAIDSFQNALTIDPHNYQAWNDRAHALYQLQNWPEAVDSWSNAIKIMPGNHLFWYNRGCALEQLEKWQDAIASYEKALEIKPDFQPGRSRYINLVADNSRSN